VLIRNASRAEEILREIGLVLSGARQVREIQGQHLWIGME
jgi:hypothetical protein